MHVLVFSFTASFDLDVCIFRSHAFQHRRLSRTLQHAAVGRLVGSTLAHQLTLLLLVTHNLLLPMHLQLVGVYKSFPGLSIE